MNRFLALPYLAILSLVALSCQQSAFMLSNDPTIPESNMKATITQNLHYDNLPSASGLEMLGDHYYVVGDDSPFLYGLDKNFQIVSREAIFDTTGFENGRIDKAEKADLEGITLLQHQGKPYLLMMGSGSAPARRKAYLYNICGDDICREGAGKEGARTIDLNNLYSQIEEQVGLEEGSLNIEGVAAGHGKLYLLQRAIATGQNVLVSYRLAEFIPYLLGEANTNLPQPDLSYFRLPVLKNLQAGFSGAYVYDDKLFFTASLEDTNDAYNDGEVLGSYIGYIPFSWVGKQDTLQIPATAISQEDGNPYTGKAESLVVQKREGKGRYRMVVVSDDDMGGSELLEVLLSEE